MTPSGLPHIVAPDSGNRSVGRYAAEGVTMYRNSQGSRGTKTIHRVLSAYVAYYNQARPHQGLGQRTPLASTEPAGQGPIRRRERLGGLLREYYREVA